VYLGPRMQSKDDSVRRFWNFTSSDGGTNENRTVRKQKGLFEGEMGMQGHGAELGKRKETRVVR
jgi:hypothetical protein